MRKIAQIFVAFSEKLKFRNIGWIMEKMVKGLPIPKWVGQKWVLIVQPEIPEMPQKFICPICLQKLKSSGFQWKKALLGVRSPWYQVYVYYHPWSLTDTACQHVRWNFELCNLAVRKPPMRLSTVWFSSTLYCHS